MSSKGEITTTQPIQNSTRVPSLVELFLETIEPPPLFIHKESRKYWSPATTGDTPTHTHTSSPKTANLRWSESISAHLFLFDILSRCQSRQSGFVLVFRARGAVAFLAMLLRRHLSVTPSLKTRIQFRQSHLSRRNYDTERCMLHRHTGAVTLALARTACRHLECLPFPRYSARRCMH